jgi:hypothetical protein
VEQAMRQRKTVARRKQFSLSRLLTVASTMGCVLLAVFWPAWREQLRAQGVYNRVADNFGVVGGGSNNQAGDNVGTTTDRPYATVAGGLNNNALGERAAIGGGSDNIASEFAATVPGGFGNYATGLYSFAAGRQAKASHAGSFVWADSTAVDFFSTGINQFLIRAGGGVGINTFAPGATLDVAGSLRATSFTLPTGAGAGRVLISDSLGNATWQDAAGGGFATLGANTFTGTQTISSGNLSLPATTSIVSGVLTLGGTRFLHAYGGLNTFLGENAGNFSMTGIGLNTGIGQNVLTNNTFGSNNTAMGQNALSANTSGYNNTVVGSAAMRLNTTGAGNTALGIRSLEANTSGFQNTAVGGFALWSNTTGFNNTAVGESALSFNTDGIDNAAFGESALLNNTTGDFNTAVGENAMFWNTSGIGNTATGHLTLFQNTNGSQNTATGESALKNNTTGSNNTASGVSALFNNTTGSGNTADGVTRPRICTSR